MLDVTGIGVRTPFGVGVDALFDGLCGRRSAILRYEPFVRAGLRHPCAAPMPAACLDGIGDEADPRGVRLLEGVVRDALAAAGADTVAALGVPAERVGLFVGTSSAGVGVLSAALVGSASPGAEARYAWDTERVARSLGFAGPVQVLCSVCAAGAQAIAEAASWIDAGLLDAAVAAGYDVLEPFVGAGFDALGATSDRPRPFRASRSGLVLGEAGAALVLARPGLARASHGRVLGWGSASDAFHLTAPHPDGAGLVAAARSALDLAGIPPDRIAAINAHGTATVYNDRMEARAFSVLFGDRAGGLPVYTVKGTIGHTLGAAGAVEAVVSLASIERGCIPPTVTEGEPDPDCDLELVTAPRASRLSNTLSVSAGFGGVNCALVLGAGA